MRKEIDHRLKEMVMDVITLNFQIVTQGSDCYPLDIFNNERVTPMRIAIVIRDTFELDETLCKIFVLEWCYLNGHPNPDRMWNVSPLDLNGFNLVQPYNEAIAIGQNANYFQGSTITLGDPTHVMYILGVDA